jgi:hypothetical protein
VLNFFVLYRLDRVSPFTVTKGIPFSLSLTLVFSPLISLTREGCSLLPMCEIKEKEHSAVDGIPGIYLGELVQVP